MVYRNESDNLTPLSSKHGSTHSNQSVMLGCYSFLFLSFSLNLSDNICTFVCETLLLFPLYTLPVSLAPHSSRNLVDDVTKLMNTTTTLPYGLILLQPTTAACLMMSVWNEIRHFDFVDILNIITV